MEIIAKIKRWIKGNRLPNPEDIRAQGGITMSKRVAKRKARELEKKLDRETKN